MGLKQRMAGVEAVGEHGVEATEEHVVRLAIEGLREVEPGVFEVSGARRIEANWEAIKNTLVRGGLAEADAIRYTEGFANTVFVGEIAKAIAARARLV